MPVMMSSQLHCHSSYFSQDPTGLGSVEVLLVLGFWTLLLHLWS